MAPKAKGPEQPAVASSPPPADPLVVAAQDKLDKWSARLQLLQQKMEDAVKGVQTLESQQTQSQAQLVKLQEQATEIATKRLGPAPSAPAPPLTAVAPGALAVAPQKGAAATGKSPRGKAAAEPAPPPPPPPPVEPPAPPVDLEEEGKKRAKITTSLLNLYKRKRAPPAGGNSTPRDEKGTTAADAMDSPRSPSSQPAAVGTGGAATVAPPIAALGENIPKPSDVPSELWMAVLGLRNERLAIEERVALNVGTLDKRRAHVKAVASMIEVTSYALAGAERDLQAAVLKAEEKRAAEQAAKEAASVAAAAAAPSPPQAKKK